MDEFLSQITDAMLKIIIDKFLVLETKLPLSEKPNTIAKKAEFYKVVNTFSKKTSLFAGFLLVGKLSSEIFFCTFCKCI